MKKNKINVGDVVIFTEGTIDENHLLEGVVVKMTRFIFPMKYHVLYFKDGREQINEFLAEELYLKNTVDKQKNKLNITTSKDEMKEINPIYNDVYYANLVNVVAQYFDNIDAIISTKRSTGSFGEFVNANVFVEHDEREYSELPVVQYGFEIICEWNTLKVVLFASQDGMFVSNKACSRRSSTLAYCKALLTQLGIYDYLYKKRIEVGIRNEFEDSFLIYKEKEGDDE